LNDVEVRSEPQIEVSRLASPRWAVIGIFLLLLVSGIAAAQEFLMPLLLAFLLALVFTPLRRTLNRVGVPSWVCAVLVILGLMAGIAAGAMLLTQPITEWVTRAPQLGGEIEAKLRNLREPVENIAQAGEQLDELTAPAPEPGTQTVEVKEAGLSDRIAEMVPVIGAQAGFVLVLLFFLIASGDMFYEKLVHVMPTFTDKRRALRIAFDIERRLSHYLSTISVINAGLGLSVAGAMWMLEMPTPLLFGLMAFLLNFIPYVGAVIGIVVTVLIGLISLPDPWLALLAGGAYFALTTIEGQFVTPYFVGRVLQLNTVVVFVAIAFWAWLWSVVGMIIAVPTLVVIRVLCEHVDSLEPLGDFLTARGAEVETEPDVPQSAPTVGDSEPT
jgi:predicted PurR-regulated permease PerM